jgi:hypothetical protein
LSPTKSRFRSAQVDYLSTPLRSRTVDQRSASAADSLDLHLSNHKLSGVSDWTVSLWCNPQFSHRLFVAFSPPHLAVWSDNAPTTMDTFNYTDPSPPRSTVLEPDPIDLYVPPKATSEVWNAFRLSHANPTHAWCTICHVWLSVSQMPPSLRTIFPLREDRSR